MKIKSAAIIALAAGSAIATAGEPVSPVSGSVVVREGDVIDGSAVSIINAPFTNGLGQMGTVLGLEDGRRAIWYDTGVVFISDETLTGGESTMGIGNNGQFIYSPSYNGADSVFGQDGVILADGDPAPGYPGGFFSTFNSRPQMIDDGTAFWVGGINDGAGGGSTAQRALFKRGPDGTIGRVISSGDVIGNSGGLTVDFPSGVDFDYHVSGNGAFMINALTADAPTASDTLIAVNGAMVAREGGATGQGDNWQNFDNVSINNSGNYVFSGDTDGATASDEFLAYNGQIGLREGMSVDGLTLGGSVNAASINNLNQAAFIWSTAEATETLFFATDASDMASSTLALLSVGDLFDEDDDGIGDWIIDDFNASGTIGPGLDLAEDGFLFVEVDLAALDGSGTHEAIISIRVPAPTTALPFAIAGLLGVRRRR